MCIFGLAAMGILVVSQGVKATTVGYLWSPCVWWWVGTSTGDGEPLVLHADMEWIVEKGGLKQSMDFTMTIKQGKHNPRCDQHVFHVALKLCQGIVEECVDSGWQAQRCHCQTLRQGWKPLEIIVSV